MDITLTWDLFIIVFFAVIITYSFIIGRKEAIKIIIATYIAIVGVQGIGNVLQRVAGEASSLLTTLGLSLDLGILSIFKLVLFIIIIIALAIKAGITVTYDKEPGMPLNAVLTGLFGFSTAGLLLSTMLTYTAGMPLLDRNLPNVAALSPIIQQSQLMQFMILNQDLWFSLPALALLIAGIVGNRN
ncbi:MAG TPA: hypothetical protein VI873_01525 [Candidatus Peribacteraceae bacterium]|nr:hypothetical protein [Candidatus Peribacteraceae bacterium]